LELSELAAPEDGRAPLNTYSPPWRGEAHWPRDESRIIEGSVPNDEKPQRGGIFISMSLRWSFRFRDSITINISPRWG
jgi:hypothetical protein